LIRTAQTDKYLVSQPGAHEVFWTLAPGNISIRWEADPAENRYRGAVDVKRAAGLYAQGRTLRQIGAQAGRNSRHDPLAPPAGWRRDATAWSTKGD
jgi:hypothetical protein